jgi:SAM-dependent methyltransferase
MSNIFKRADIYSIIYEQKNYKKEVSFILNKLKKYNVRAKTVLELGSGIGGHAKYLCKKGIKVTGVDRSKSMIDGSIKDKNFINILGDIKKINLKKKFDVAVSMFHVLSYQISNNHVKKTFLNANKHLNKGSYFLFDFWYSPAVKNLKAENKQNIYKSKNIIIKKYVNVKNLTKINSVKVNYTFKVKEKNILKEKQFKETHQMRHFSLKEIKQFSKMTGFKFCESCELVTNRKVNKNTWGVFVVLKKIRSIKQ